MIPLYIFDIDGTLALLEHRKHLLWTADKDRWDKFYNLAYLDKPNMPIIKILEAIKSSGADIWFFSGRRESISDMTVAWICENTSFTLEDFNIATLTMRPNGEHMQDDKLKKRFLFSMLPCDRERLVAIFDDRERVVDMWRRNGITCLQVAPGDF